MTDGDRELLLQLYRALRTPGMVIEGKQLGCPPGYGVGMPW